MAAVWTEESRRQLPYPRLHLCYFLGCLWALQKDQIVVLRRVFLDIEEAAGRVIGHAGKSGPCHQSLPNVAALTISL